MRKNIIIFLLGIFFCLIQAFIYPDSATGITYIKNGQVTGESNFTAEDDFKQIIPIDSYWNEYTDYANGFKIRYPNHMLVDVSLSPIKIAIFDKEREIEIYYDDFSNTVSSEASYINYSKGFLKNQKDHIKEYENTVRVDGKKTHLLKWGREKLSKIQNDKNYYVSAEIVKNKNEVYTIFIKSTTPFKNYEDYMNVINSFSIVPKEGKPKITASFQNENKEWNEETKDFYEKYFKNSNKLHWGIFENTAPNDFDFLNSLEKKLDYTFDFLVKYQCFSSGGFPMKEMINAYNNNRYVELTFQTMYNGEKDNSSIMYDILKGKYDSYFADYAKNIKEFGHPILFRLNNEMNGDWCVYSSYHASKDAGLFKAVWKYVYEIFEENGVDNVLWVWNPHDISFPNFKWNHYLNYYPGNEYVDIVGLTGYNTGTYYPGERWRGFSEVYVPLYQEYASMFQQPLMITEFGSNSVGGDKISWIQEMFAKIQEFDRIKVAIWWNGIDWDSNNNPARIYRLDQNENTIEAFRKGLQVFSTDKLVD